MHHSDEDRYYLLTIPDRTAHGFANFYGFSLREAIQAVETGSMLAFGPLSGLPNARTARYEKDINRFVSILEQMSLLRGTQVMTLSYRCPLRLKRYTEAMAFLTTKAAKHGIPQRTAYVIERVLRAVSAVTAEVTDFYRGLS
jgi:hypothetical protein